MMTQEQKWIAEYMIKDGCSPGCVERILNITPSVMDEFCKTFNYDLVSKGKIDQRILDKKHGVDRSKFFV